ncbi:MAG: hypothetical protein ABJA80_16925 [bacterium]
MTVILSERRTLPVVILSERSEQPVILSERSTIPVVILSERSEPKDLL